MGPLATSVLAHPRAPVPLLDIQRRVLHRSAAVPVSALVLLVATEAVDSDDEDVTCLLPLTLHLGHRIANNMGGIAKGVPDRS